MNEDPFATSRDAPSSTGHGPPHGVLESPWSIVVAPLALAVVAWVALLVSEWWSGFRWWYLALFLLLVVVAGSAFAFRGHKRRRQESFRQSDWFKAMMAASMITALDLKDPGAAEHAEWVAEMSRRLAEDMGLSADRVEGVRLGGLLHDIGLISVPDEILHQDPTALSSWESFVLPGHALAGSRLLGSMPELHSLVQMGAQHHEHLDGSGYPAGLRGDDIVLEAQIVAVVEAVAEMTTTTPYYQGLAPEEVEARLLAGRGTLYDSAVVDAYLDLSPRCDASPDDASLASAGLSLLERRGRLR